MLLHPWRVYFILLMSCARLVRRCGARADCFGSSIGSPAGRVATASFPLTALAQGLGTVLSPPSVFSIFRMHLPFAVHAAAAWVQCEHRRGKARAIATQGTMALYSMALQLMPQR